MAKLIENINLFEMRIKGHKSIEDNSEETWLTIECSVRKEDISWTFSEPILTAKEMRLFLDWMKSILDKKIIKDKIDFIEPNLSFEISNSKKLKIFFELESLPEKKVRPVGDKDFFIEFNLDKINLNFFYLDLKEQFGKIIGDE